MKRSREQMKAELLREAEVVIDEVLEWHEATPAPTLTQIEDVILKLRKRLGRRVAEVVLREQEAKRPVPGPSCPTCRQEMGYKGMKEVGVESRLGSVEVGRGYYYCDRCRSGLFPPRQATGVMGEALERRCSQAGSVVEWVGGL